MRNTPHIGIIPQCWYHAVYIIRGLTPKGQGLWDIYLSADHKHTILDRKTSSNTLIQFKAFSNTKEECIQRIQRGKQKFQNMLQDTIDKKCRHLYERQSELNSFSSSSLALAFGTLNTSLNNKKIMDYVNMSVTSNGY